MTRMERFLIISTVMGLLFAIVQIILGYLEVKSSNVQTIQKSDTIIIEDLSEQAEKEIGFTIKDSSPEKSSLSESEKNILEALDSVAEKGQEDTGSKDPKRELSESEKTLLDALKNK